MCPSEKSDQPGVSAVWSESSHGAFWVAKDAELLHVDNEEAD